jgi:esterase/lipase superfamily enzyme/putative methionine-R-sulfoxide reductase with GAF domain/CheY-like chemotaxis protein
MTTLLDGMQRAGLDVTLYGLLDAIWLALQPGFRLETQFAKKEISGPNIGDGLPDREAGAGGDLPPSESFQGPEKLPEPKHENVPPVTPIADKLGVYAAGAAEGVMTTLPASPLRIPSAAALANRLPLTRSLRPLRRAFRNTRFLDLNEEATAEATADARGMLMPVLQPRLERWYELILVTDSVPSMDVWVETILEFEEVTRTAGVFRDVRHYRLVWKPNSVVPTPETAVLLNSAGAPFPAVTLAQTNVRRMIFIATNGSAAHWTDGRMAALLGVWSKQCSIAITHMLPERFWPRVRTGEPELALTTLSPGASAATLDAVPAWWDEDLHEANTIKRIPGAIPILPLDPAWVEKWARMQMGGGQRVPGIIVAKRPEKDAHPNVERRTAEDWKRAVDRFIHNCTPQARMLAVYLSQATFTLPVARLVQAAKLGQASSQTQLAEILLSGLVQRTTAPDQKIPHEWVEYQFHPEAAKVLARGLRESDAREIADALAKHIERYWGKPVDFRALVYDREGRLAIPPWAQPFAQLGRSLIESLPPADSPSEILQRFLRSQPPRVIRHAAGLAASILQTTPINEMAPSLLQVEADLDLVRILESAGIILRDENGNPEFRPELLEELAGQLSARPLLGVHILWVDDHSDNNNSESLYLAGQGAEIASVTTTTDAVSRVQETRFDVIISEMTRGREKRAGFDLLEGLRWRKDRTPVIIYAGGSGNAERRAAFRAGAFGRTDQADELYEYVNRAVNLPPWRTVRQEIETVLLTLVHEASRMGELLDHWEQNPEGITSELLAGASEPNLAYSDFFPIIEAFANSHRSQVFLLEQGKLTLAVAYVGRGKAEHSVPSPDGIIGRAAASAVVTWVPDVDKDPAYTAADPATASKLVLPLFTAPPTNEGFPSSLIGLLNVEMPVENALSSDDIAWLTRFCAPLGPWISVHRPAMRAPLQEAPPPSASDAAPISNAEYIELVLPFVTDRERDKDGKFTAGRARELSFGECTVTIPLTHRMGKIEQSNISFLQSRPNPKKHFTLAGIRPLERPAFESALLQRLDTNRGLLVFIHGYNINFLDASFRSAQLHWDLSGDFETLIYSWPSQGTVAGYNQDQVAATSSAVHLRSLIQTLYSAYPSNNLYFLAVGLGCQALSNALVSLSSESSTSNSASNLKQIIFMRPDMDVEVFRQQVSSMSPTLGRITLYVSNRDIALRASAALHGSPRAGSVVQIIPNVDTIDVSAQDGGLAPEWTNIALLADVRDVLRNIPPASRMGLRAAQTKDGAYWVTSH